MALMTSSLPVRNPGPTKDLIGNVNFVQIE